MITYYVVHTYANGENEFETGSGALCIGIDDVAAAGAESRMGGP